MLNVGRSHFPNCNRDHPKDRLCRRSVRAARVRCPPVPVSPDLDPDVTASLQGDGDAYARIVRRFQQPLRNQMARFARSPIVVDELVQGVFVEAYFSLRRYRADAPLDHWLHRIATRVGLRYWKRRQRDNCRRVKMPADFADAREVKPDDGEALAWLLDQLSPRDRLVVTLLYLDGRSVAETADLAGWSQAMVKVQAFRARGKLRKLLEKHGPRLGLSPEAF